MTCPHAPRLDLCIVQGKTFSVTLRWGTEPYIYRTIAAVANTAPVRITVPGHGLEDGWPVAISGVKGSDGLNARSQPPARSDYRKATVIDADTIEINEINGTLLRPYKSGGVIQYLTPVDLTGKKARMQVKDRVGGNVLLTLTSDSGELVLDPAGKMGMRLSPVVAEAITWKKGVYDLEVFNADDVFLVCYGDVSVSKEVTKNG